MRSSSSTYYHRELYREMENSGESGDDGGPLGSTAFLGGGTVATSYIGVQSDMEGRLTCHDTWKANLPQYLGNSEACDLDLFVVEFSIRYFFNLYVSPSKIHVVPQPTQDVYSNFISLRF